MSNRYVEEVRWELSGALSDVTQGGSQLQHSVKRHNFLPDFPRPAGIPVWHKEAGPRECNTGRSEQVCVINGWSGSSNFDGSPHLIDLK